MNTTRHTVRPYRCSGRVAGSCWPAVLLGAIVLGCIASGHTGLRVAQMALLAVPLLAWQVWPVRGAGVHRMRTALVWLWALGFVLDGLVRAYLLNTYRAAPEGALVLGSIANTNAREGAEYFAAQWHEIAVWATPAAVCAALIGWCAQHGLRASVAVPGMPATRSYSRWAVGVVCVLLLATALAYASKPWRRLHPLLFWPAWTQSLQTLRAQWGDQQQARDRALLRARLVLPTLTQSEPATVVLVISESINRDNLALYGYGRPTTPQLLAHKAHLGSQMQVLRNAWSVDASTLPAMRSMLNFGQPESEDPLHLLAVARAAGYKVWWISNHDDMAIEQKHARLANVVDMVNRTPGRGGASLDGALMGRVQAALHDPGPHKLVVVHLMGAHPHYSLRFPDGANPFDGKPDSVEAGLLQAGRSTWVRNSRRDYDSAVLYQDTVVSKLLQMTRDTGPPQAYRAWMYLSDHGQEVGHTSDRTGHSPSTASGYRIPAVIWRNQPSADLAAQPFRADWLGWVVADLMHIQWAGNVPSRNVLQPGYRWLAPVLPAEIVSFSD